MIHHLPTQVRNLESPLLSQMEPITWVQSTHFQICPYPPCPLTSFHFRASCLSYVILFKDFNVFNFTFHCLNWYYVYWFKFRNCKRRPPTSNCRITKPMIVLPKWLGFYKMQACLRPVLSQKPYLRPVYFHLSLLGNVSSTWLSTPCFSNAHLTCHSVSGAHNPSVFPH